MFVQHEVGEPTVDFTTPLLAQTFTPEPTPEQWDFEREIAHAQEPQRGGPELGRQFRAALVAEHLRSIAAEQVVEPPTTTESTPPITPRRDYWGPISPERQTYLDEQRYLASMPWHQYSG